MGPWQGEIKPIISQMGELELPFTSLQYKLSISHIPCPLASTTSLVEAYKMSKSLNLS